MLSIFMLMTILQQTEKAAEAVEKQATELKDSGTLIWEQLASWYNSF